MRLRRTFRLFAILFLTHLLLGACAQEEKPAAEPKDTLSAALWELAAGAEAANDYEKAASYYDRLYERHPDNRKALLGYARNLRYLGLPKDAVKVLQKALERHGDDVDLRLELGKAQLASALINDARETLSQVVDGHPERWEAHSALGIISDRLEQFETAQKFYRKALELSPENVGVQNNLALSLAQSGDLANAIGILEKVVASEHSTPQSRQNLAILYGMNGQYDKAKVLAQLDLPANMAASNVATFKEIGTDTKPKAAAAEATPKKTETVARAIAERAAQPKRSAKPVTRPKSKKRPTQVAAKPVFVSVGSANVRKGPSTKHAPVAFLQKGHQVRLLGKSSDGRWSYIALADGRRGYVFHKLIRPK